jgi:pimeloyl-ACP methyl ester carboxylesterase
LKFLDPTAVQSVRSDGKTLPLAADFSAPLVDTTRNVREFLLALEGLIDPEVRDAYLGMLQPYDPEKIPVVFIHGLMSHPRMWRDVINDLVADPDISARYQFWVYYYPTGWPITYSAMRLREDLAAVDKALGRQKDIVLVGHSMGGLLARMQAISTGDALMRALLPPSRWEQFRKTPTTNIARKSIEFQENPDVERIIFISTPHRGSGMADWSLTTWFTKFIHLPSKITSSAVDLIPTLLTNPGHYTSVSRLSPSNPLYKELEKLPIAVPYHSIIGDRGRGDTPNSSDGVVPYWSSHLDSAESEVIVPDDHGAFDDPAAIAEIKRILQKNHARR